VVGPGEKAICNFSTKEKDSFVMFREHWEGQGFLKSDEELKREISEELSEEVQGIWSSPFSIENIEDFQISYHGRPKATDK